MNGHAPEQLEGQEALEYAERYLSKLRVTSGGWEIEYEDPRTGEHWVLDYPNSGYHGGGLPRLRRKK